MTILEFAPYMNGDLFTRVCPEPARCTPELYDKVLEAVAASETALKSAEYIGSYLDYMYAEPDIACLFPLSEREEMFYCLKNGGYCEDVPAKCIYTFKELFNVYGSVSLALKALDANTIKVFFQQNYLHECTMRDVVKNFIDPDYEPITAVNMRVKHKDYDEVYIAATDMVALLPKALSEKLSDNDLTKITCDREGLKVDGLLLRQLGGYFGACNSIYDLRALV